MNRRLFIYIILGYLPIILLGQCPGTAGDTILQVDFEGIIPEDWQLIPPTDGGQWQKNSGKIGFYENPGAMSWLYVNDEQNNDIGTALLQTGQLDLADFTSQAFVEFDLLFQEYADSSYLTVEVFDGVEWVEVLYLDEDFSGRLQIDLEGCTHSATQIRFLYHDEGAWAWGMGLDNFMVYGQRSLCENDQCDPGEDPLLCSDCPLLEAPAPLWIDVGKNLLNEDVNYRYFKGKTACDDCSEEIALPFSFDLFGKEFDKVYINSNGNLTFENEFITYTPEPFCLEGPKMIAPFFGDVDLQKGGEILYYLDDQGHYLIATWQNVGYFGCDFSCKLRNTFQAIITDGTITIINNQPLPEGTTVVFNYGDMQWTTGNSSGGIAGLGGSAATVGMNEGDGHTCHDYGTFDHESYIYFGKYQDDRCPPNGVSHLDYRSLTINGQSGKIVTPNGKVTFTATQEENQIVLQWIIDDLSKFMSFIIERSEDGNVFDQLEWLDRDQYQIPGLYTFTDTAPLDGDGYYRLVQLLTNGDQSYSDTILIPGENGELNWQASSRFLLHSVGPNPFQSHIQMKYYSPNEMEGQCRIIDMSGRVVAQRSFQPVTGMNQSDWQLDQLIPGRYILQFIHPHGMDSRQLLKK